MIPHRRARLVLESPVTTPDGGGGHSLSWTPVGYLWGAIEPRSGRETAPADARASRVSHRIRLAREPGAARRPGAHQRLRLGERVFAIHAVAETEDGAGYTLWVEEGPFS